MAKPVIQCKMCRDVGPAADSHIIPRAFYEQAKAGHDFLKVLSNAEGTRPTINRIGFYDRALLCQRCEARFQPFDDYGIKLLLHPRLEPDGSGQIWGFYASLIRDVDPQRFNEFLAFLVWRVLASDLPAFQAIRNPAVEGRLRAALHMSRLDTEPFVQALLTRVRHSFALPEGLNSVWNGTAYQDRFEGVQMVNIGLGDLLFKVKLGAEALPPPYDELSFPDCLSRWGGLLVLGDAENSNRQIRIARKVALEAHAQVKIKDLSRRVAKRFPHPALQKKRLL